MDKKAIKWMKDNKITVIYENVSKAMPMSVNGYPMFHSFETLTDSEYKTVLSIRNDLRNAIDGTISRIQKNVYSKKKGSAIKAE